MPELESLLDLAKGDRILTIPESSWLEYEAIAKIDSRYLISFIDNVITIVAPGRNHERITETIKILINAYCRKYRIPYFALGSEDIKKENVVGKQPDASYCFESLKPEADLAIEVNFTSGSINDLEKYRRLNIKEVWIWQQNKLRFFSLLNDNFIEVKTSIALDKITSDFLSSFLQRATEYDNLTIETNFFESLNF